MNATTLIISMIKEDSLLSQISIMNYHENKAYSIPMGIKNAQKKRKEFCWFSFLYDRNINLETKK